MADQLRFDELDPIIRHAGSQNTDTGQIRGDGSYNDNTDKTLYRTPIQSRYYVRSSKSTIYNGQSSNYASSSSINDDDADSRSGRIKKSFTGRVIFAMGATTGKVRRIYPQRSSSRSNAIKTINCSNDAYESFSDNEDEDNISDYLNSLCKKDAIDIVDEITSDDSTLNSYLRQERMDKNTLFAITRAVGKICQSGSHAEIMEEICTSGLPHAIRYYLKTSYRRRERGSSRQVGEFFENLIPFYSSAMKIVVIEERELWTELIEMTKRAIRFLNGRYDRSRETILVKRLENIANDNNDTETDTDMEPDTVPVGKTYRNHCALLTRDDLDQTDMDERHLRKMKPIGRYESVDEYLETLYGLRREDFVAPLRFGIGHYLQSKYESKPKLKSGSIKIYENVRFDGVTRTNDGRICLSMNFDFTGRLERFKWEATKRLTLGSLLILSSDAFESFFYAVIVERTLEKLRKTHILVVLDDDAVLDEMLFETSFVMAETEVYYEKYRQCMAALKNFDDRNFPLTEYLVNVNQVSNMPKYITSLLNSDGWPVVSELGLDSWQCAAFKYVLTKNLCLIRGAPGTGKTFLTVRIVRILLQMAKLYPNAIKTPILIVYATNRALDEFLTRISQIQPVPDIVRIAGQSRHEILKQFDLRGRVKLSSTRTNNETVWPELTKAADELNECRTQIDAVNFLIESVTNDGGIVTYSILSGALTSDQKEIFTGDDDVLNWLLDGQEVESNGDDDDDDENEETSKVDRRLALDEDEIADEWSIVNEDETVFTKQTPIDFRQFYCCTVASLKESLKKATDEYSSLTEKSADNRGLLRTEKKRLEETIKSTRNRLNTMKLYGKKGENEEYPNDKYQFSTGSKAWTLSMEARWICYRNWMHSLKIAMFRVLAKNEYEYRRLTRDYEKVKRKEDLFVAQNAQIVGATIAGAVAFQDVLKELRPAIVICEEANRILEADLVAALTNDCQQLILLGDEKQMKPATDVFKLNVKFNYGLSLFERLLNNRIESVTLNNQYRMRLEIASLLKSLVYGSLENDDGVCKYESIVGMTKNVYFLDHDVSEQENDSRLKQNIFEAQFAIELSRYLVANGYKGEQITLLSSHEAQVYTLKETKREYEMLRNVKCCFVDDYAGRINDIVILCLVRSNDKGQLGLLIDENRTYLSLSRATKGLYVLGNMKMLSNHSKLWYDVKKVAESQNAIGTEMALRCEIHDKITYVSSAEDFDQVERGGCSEICGLTIPCGHTCKNTCHFADRTHTNVKCKERCRNKCSRDLHPCKLRCDEKCRPCNVLVTETLTCGHDAEIRCHEDVTAGVCSAEIDEKSSLCGHIVHKICGQPAEEEKCSVRCKAPLECGHTCSLKCHERTDPDHSKYICRKDCSRKCPKNHKCTKKCYEKCEECTVNVIHKFDCGHEYELPCNASQTSNFKCCKPCLKVCPNCGTKCTKKCYQKCPPCETMVEKVIEECGHKFKTKCSSDPPKRDKCTKMCARTAPCGHRCVKLCRKPCDSSDCDTLVRLDGVEGLCGHDFVNVPCKFKEDVLEDVYDLLQCVDDCDAKCNVKLMCNHLCQATCKECYPGKFHKRCQQKCTKTLLCGHKCKFLCEKYSSCPPCDEPCPYRCKHSKCVKKCGELCVSCPEKCEWRCKHLTCKRECGEICNRKPCYVKCAKKLKCNHPCIGFCGEPCPPKCRVCDQGKLSDMPGDDSDKPDARYVVLIDCNHIFESNQLDEYFNMSAIGKIVVKGCPLCHTPITKTLRFMNYVKQMYSHLNNVKKTLYGDSMSNFKRHCELSQKFTMFEILLSQADEFPCKEDVVAVIRYLMAISCGLSKFGSLDWRQLMSMEISCETVAGIVVRLPELVQIPLEMALCVFTSLNDLVASLANAIEETSVRLTIQQVTDLMNELKRLQRWIDYTRIKQFVSKHPDLRYRRILIDECYVMEKELTESVRFTEEIYKKVNRSHERMQLLAPDVRLPPLTAINTKLPKCEDVADDQLWFVCSKGHYTYTPKEGMNCSDCKKVRKR